MHALLFAGRLTLWSRPCLESSASCSFACPVVSWTSSGLLAAPAYALPHALAELPSSAQLCPRHCLRPPGFCAWHVPRLLTLSTGDCLSMWKDFLHLAFSVPARLRPPVAVSCLNPGSTSLTHTRVSKQALPHPAHVVLVWAPLCCENPTFSTASGSCRSLIRVRLPKGSGYALTA